MTRSRIGPGYEDYHQEAFMGLSTGVRLKSPAHPGGFISSEIVEALGVTRPAVSALLNERSQLSFEMALRIETAFGVSMDTLTRMQNSFNIAQARTREIDVLPFRGAQVAGETGPG